MSALCEKLTITKQDEVTFQLLRTEVIEKVNRAIAQIEDVNSKVDSTDNYLARYLPFNFFVQCVEACKMVTPELKTNRKLRETFNNYEKFKTKELYQSILFDDGKAPRQFSKDFLVVGRKEINELLQEDVRLTSQNIRSVRAGNLVMK